MGPHQMARLHVSISRELFSHPIFAIQPMTARQDDLESDPLVAGRPIVLQSKDGHALWVSKKVLRLMEPIPDAVEGGIIIRDSHGNPTGIFIDNAQELVTALRPEPT